MVWIGLEYEYVAVIDFFSSLDNHEKSRTTLVKKGWRSIANFRWEGDIGEGKKKRQEMADQCGVDSELEVHGSPLILRTKQFKCFHSIRLTLTLAVHQTSLVFLHQHCRIHSQCLSLHTVLFVSHSVPLLLCVWCSVYLVSADRLS